jgi:hypothetical protein
MTRYTAFRCPVDLLRHARSIADAERRSLSNYIISLLERDWIRYAGRRDDEEATRQHLYRASDTR